MQIYRQSEDPFLDLYARLKARPGAHYHGALAQPALAQELKRAAYLAYPCTFVETFRVVAMEAIAAGLESGEHDALGALPETTLGFADLVSLTAGMGDAELAPLYAEHLQKNVMEFREKWAAWAADVKPRAKPDGQPPLFLARPRPGMGKAAHRRCCPQSGTAGRRLVRQRPVKKILPFLPRNVLCMDQAGIRRQEAEAGRIGRRPPASFMLYPAFPGDIFQIAPDAGSGNRENSPSPYCSTASSIGADARG